jgi:hypothetical protein
MSRHATSDMSARNVCCPGFPVLTPWTPEPPRQDLSAFWRDRTRRSSPPFPHPRASRSLLEEAAGALYLPCAL